MVERKWQADVVVDPALAARLISEQFPALSPVSLVPFGEGWDNAAFLVNDVWVFRFPRREVAALIFSFEVPTLPLIAAGLPLPVPVPAFVGAPADGYPYGFSGYRILPGTTACSADLTDAARSAMAPALGGFLRALHATPETPALLEAAPKDLIGRADLAKKVGELQARVDKLTAIGQAIDGDAIKALGTSLSATPAWQGPLCLVHGDLYERHLVVRDRELAGVIDWGDVHWGDPALDLMIAWSFLPSSAHAAFRSAYGAIDDATWQRARFRALCYAVTLVWYGDDIGDRTLYAAGHRHLARLVGRTTQS